MTTPGDHSADERRRFVLSDTGISAAYLILVSFTYFVFTAYFAVNRSLWYDELFTYYVASLPDIPTIYRSLLSGMDNHPPLSYVLCHLSMAMFGHSALAERIPSILAFYFTLLCLFFYLRRLHSTVAGILGSSLLLASPAMMYAVEARTYALLLAFGTASIVLWHRLSADEHAPKWMWFALSGCLAGSLWSHYYAVLLVIAFAVAGVVDWIDKRKFPVKLFLAGSGAGVAALPVIPFARAAASYGTHFWAIPATEPIRPLRDSFGNFEFACEVVMLAAICVLVFSRLRAVKWFTPAWHTTPMKLPTSQIALLLCLLFGPVMQWVLARTVTNAYTWRYTIESAAAASVIAGLFLARGCGRHPNVALALCVACVLQAPNSLARLRLYRDTRAQILKTVEALDARLQTSPLPIAAPHGNNYLAYYFYGSDRVKKNVVMLLDEDAAVRLGGTDNNQIALEHLARFVPLRLEQFSDFTAQNPGIRVAVGRFDGETWIVPKLQEAGYRVMVPPRSAEGIMYECYR